MVRIIFLEPQSYIPDFYADFDGAYSLDLNNNERVALSRIIDDYADVGKLKQDTFKEFEIPITKKNRLLIGNIGNPSALNELNSKIFRIQLLKGDFSYPVSGLQIVSVSDSSYSVILFGEVNQWSRPLENLFLNELELGQAVIDLQYIFDQSATVVYQDDDDPVFFPLVNYGRWFIESNSLLDDATKSQVVFNNFRHWFAPLAIMKQMFCQIGYQLIIPILETNKYRQLRTYTLDPEFETANQLDVANRPFEAELDGDFIFEGIFFTYSNGATFGGIMNFPDIISDPGSHTFVRVPSGTSTENYHGFFYSAGAIATFNTKGTVRIQIPSGPLFPQGPEFVTLRVFIKKSYRYGIGNQDELNNFSQVLATKTFTYKSPLLSGVPVDFNFDITTSQVKVYEHEVVYVQFEYDAFLIDGGGSTYTEAYLNDYTDLLAGATFSNVVDKQVIEKGDTIEFGKLLHSQKTCLDYMKGIAHLLGLKIESNSVERVVSMYPEFKMDLGAEGVQEAFFRDNQDDALFLDDKIQVKSMIQSFRNTDLNRDVYLKFLDSSDGFIQNQNLTDEAHSKKIDLGPDFNDGENKIENPFFEPIMNGIDGEISGLTRPTGPYSGETASNYIPFMWESRPTDNDVYPDVGFDFEPRIMFCVSFEYLVVEPSVTGKSNTTESSFIFEDLIFPTIQTGAQIYPLGVQGRTLLVYSDLPNTIVYGSDLIEPTREDLYSLIYSRIINQAYFNIALEFLVLIDLLEFSNISFRRKVHIKYKSQAWGEINFFARLSKVTDYVIGENLTTPVEVIPDNNNFLYC